MIKSFMDKLGKRFIQFQVSKKELPDFSKSKLIRYDVIFEGDVQGVGFRYEVAQLAERLDITGCVKNLANSNVEAELQGEENKLVYLLDFFETHKRIQVDNINKNKVKTLKEESNFEIVM